MKKILFLLIINLSLFADSQECTQYTVSIKESKIIENIKIPSTVITKLHKGDFVCVYSVSDNWAKLGDGWISKDSIIKVQGNQKDDNDVIGPFITMMIVIMFILYILIHIFTTPKSDGRFSTGFRDNVEPMPFTKKLKISFIISLISSIAIFMNTHT